MRTLREHGHRALFAGGCVRDELLGLAPTDYDVATEANPDRVRQLFPGAGEVGKAFGVMLVRVDRVVVEVATFRSDGVYSDGRRPDDVRFAGEVEDARRRDFTINALFLDPLDADGAEVPPERSVEPGRVIDHVGGVADLARRQIRAVGVPAERLAEDHLRALRAIRFACRLQFSIDQATREAIAADASQLAGVSRERIGDELRKMLVDASRSRAVILLEELGLDAPVLEERGLGPRERCSAGALVALGGQPAGGAAAGPSGADPMAALAAWLLDRGSLNDGPAAVPAVIRRTRKALMLSNDERDRLRGALDTLFELERAWEGLGVAGRKRLIARPGFRGGLSLLAGRDAQRWASVREAVVELEATPGGIAPEPLLTGDDLIGLGLQPGPGFALVLNRVYDAQLEGRVGSKEEARLYVRGLERP